jgi:hypothetical protein
VAKLLRLAGLEEMNIQSMGTDDLRSLIKKTPGEESAFVKSPFNTCNAWCCFPRE